jgi:hypothetical protein
MNRQLLKVLVLCMVLAGLMGCSQEQQMSISAGGCAVDKAWLDPHTLPTEVPSEETLCQFHQFVMEHFLAETYWEPDPQFLDWMPVAGVFTPEGNVQENPTPWGSQPKIPKELCPNAPDTAPVFSDLVYQAGKPRPLMDQAGNYVFYGVRVNKTQYDYTIECDLQTDKTCANKEVDGTRYPKGSVETKIGWKILNASDDPARYIAVEGWVKNPEGGECTKETLGLVGYHLVVASKRHPEFIWGTFEHIDNNPNCDNQGATPPVGGWSFYKKDCPDCPDINTYVEGKPAQVCLQHPQGGGKPENQEDIVSLNASYQEVLKGHMMANYKFVGSLWTKDGKPPIEKAQRGSLLLANSVAETYYQGDASGDGTLNCFVCHNYKTEKESLKVSHINEVLPKKSPTLRAKMK